MVAVSTSAVMGLVIAAASFGCVRPMAGPPMARAMATPTTETAVVSFEKVSDAPRTERPRCRRVHGAPLENVAARSTTSGSAVAQQDCDP
jgi:hypothetical protein